MARPQCFQCQKAGQRRHNCGPHTALALTNHDKGEAIVMAGPYVCFFAHLARDRLTHLAMIETGDQG